MPHLPSLDIRDGALDYLFNVYKKILPSLGDYITNHGGQVNLSHVDVILAEVGSIEDHVFTMKHQNEERDKERREQFKARKKQANGRSLDAPTTAIQQQKPKVMGRAARILEKQKGEQSLKKEVTGKIQSSHMKSRDNLQAAVALKESFNEPNVKKDEGEDSAQNEIEMDLNGKDGDASKAKIESEKKRKFDKVDGESGLDKDTSESGVGVVGNIGDEFDKDDGMDEDEGTDVAFAFKERVKTEQRTKLDEYARTVDDKVKLHEKGWKDRYYSDKCKADDVANHGGRDHLFRSYVMGLCWVMKYYYEGCKFIVYLL